MTTIAFDGKTLAADTQSSAGGMPFRSIKAYRLSDGRLYAGSGAAEECEAVRQWLENGGDKPVVKDFVGLVIVDGRCFRIEDKLVLFLVDERFHAIGSGRDYAMSAMYFGKSARDAVKFASQYDVWTNDHVTELHVNRVATVQLTA